MKQIIRLSATGSIIGWDKIHIDQYIEYLKSTPSIASNHNWR